MSGLPGVDLDALTAWLDSTAPGLRRGSLSGVRIAGGMSNLTLRITDGTTTWALRRPPLGHVLPTAHDMAREFRILSALHGTAVPVPRPIALCEEPEVLGAQFYLMEFVEGVVLDTTDALELLGILSRLGREGAARIRQARRVPRPAAAPVGCAVGRLEDPGAPRSRRTVAATPRLAARAVRARHRPR